MATTQEDLLKALRGSSGREQVNFDLGQVGLRPTIQQGGQYQVQVRDAPKTNSALQLATALQGGSQLLSSFVDLQTKQGEIEANALTPAEVQQKVEQGDPTAVNFLDKLGKEKTFTENVYKRYFTSTVQPKLQTLAQELKNRPVHEYADMGITTPEDFAGYANGRVQELTDEFNQYTSKSPYAQSLHNQLIETVVPDLVQRQVAMFDEGVTEFNKKSAIEGLPLFNAGNGTDLTPTATPSNEKLPVSLKLPTDNNVLAVGETPNPLVETGENEELVTPEPPDVPMSFDDSVENLLQVSEESLKQAKIDPVDRSKILREHVVTQLRTLSTDGDFVGARKLLATLGKSKVNNQPLFGSANGQLQLSTMEDAIDREEDQEYALNERTSKKKVEQEIAGVSLRLLNATSETLEDVYGKVRGEISERQGLTESEKVIAIKELDQLYQNRASAEYTKATRSDATLNKLNVEGGSTDAFTNFRSIAASDDRIAGFVANSKLLQEKALIQDPLTGKQAINPAFTQQMRSSIVNVGAEKNMLNEEQTQKIRRGESFTYDFNGKSVMFEGSTDLNQQKQLHRQLGQAFQEDLNSSLTKQLENDIAVNPLFAKAQGAMGQPMNDTQKRFQEVVQQLKDSGVPIDKAESEAFKVLTKETKTTPLLEKEQVRDRNTFETPEDYTKSFTTAINSKQFTPEQAFIAHGKAKFNNNLVIKQNVAKIASNPVANLTKGTAMLQSFKDVGVPWDAVQDGYIKYTASIDPSSNVETEGYFSIRAILMEADSESNYQMIPPFILKNKDTEEGKKVIEKIAEKYGKTYDALVSGQESWYETRNIKISK